MLKRVSIALLALLLAALAYLWLAQDLSPAQFTAGARLATGMGAKLACSSRHLSGFDQTTIEEDILTYSPLMAYLRYDYPAPGLVEADYIGSPTARARYRPGLGCTLEYGPNELDAVVVPDTTPLPGVEWPRGSAVRGADPAVQALLDEILQADNAAGERTRALLVVKDGRVVAESYAPGITAATPLLGWSMGKSITAILLGRLEALGLADIAQSRLFPEWQGDERSAISMENLLQMNSGLDFEEDYLPGSDSTRMLFMSPAASEVALASKLGHAPGSHFYYSSGTTNLLSRLVFQRTGNSLQQQVDFFHREFVLPLGLQNTVLEPDSTGVVVGSSYVYASARDWARFGQLMLAGGKLNGRRLLSRDWVRRAVQPNGSANYPAYGYQFWLNSGDEPLWPSLPADAYAMLGNRKQVVMVVPGAQAVIVRLGWSSGEYPTDSNFLRILAALDG